MKFARKTGRGDYFIGVRLTDDFLEVGGRILFMGHSTSLEQNIDSMQIKQESMQGVEAGQSTGIMIGGRIRPNDIAYRI